MYQELNYGAGICRDQTQLAAKARWFDGNFVRFRDGYPEWIGGWGQQQLSGPSLGFGGGVPRAIKQWNALDGTQITAVGTSAGLFIIIANLVYDITPFAHVSSPLAANPITTTLGSPIITVLDAGYTPGVGQAVIISGATAVGGIPATAINQTLTVLTLVAGGFTCNTGTNATSNATGGGAAVIVSYEIPPGPNESTTTGGYSDGPYGAGPYGATPGTSQTIQPTLWYLDNYGQDLVATVRDAGIYYWAYSSGVTSHAVTLASIGDASTPIVAKFVMTAAQTQSLIAYGANEIGATTEDPMLVRWSAPGSATLWTPTITSPAGFLRLSSGSQILTTKATVGQSLVLTDETAYSQQYLGPPVVYSFTPVGQHINLVAPNAAASLGSSVVWMGLDNFFIFSGTINPLPCEVRDFVFSNLNIAEQYKFFACVNRRFDEVWWFYVSLASNEIDSYVMYSLVENCWSIGMLSRTAWSDEQGNPFPIATDPAGNLYSHEFGTDANGTALTPYVISSEQSIQSGDRLGMVRRASTDIFFRTNPNAPPLPTPQSATIQFLYRDSSNLPFRTTPGYVVTQGQTDLIYPRFRGRNIALKISSNSIGTTLRAGITRIDVISDGRR